MCHSGYPDLGFWRNPGRLGSRRDQLDDLNLEGKIVALYGLGINSGTVNGSSMR